MSNQVAVNMYQQGKSGSRAEIRGHQLVCDRPEAKGGEDQGAMGGEVMLAGLGGCFMSNLLAAAQARNITLDDTRVKVIGTLEGNPLKFTDIVLQVAGTHADQDEFEKLVVIAERGCIVANTLKSAVKLRVAVVTHP
ncbi:MAG: OsmC family peroxiredoxin [Desulfobulbaceae bacterium]|nr:MAG: OsmC family peroxiredoxin [Desulfobulbaceae bacterium]